MLQVTASSLVKFLIGTFLLQTVTALLVITALTTTDIHRTIVLFILLGLCIGTLTAFWFNSLVESTKQEALARAKARHLREREKIRVKAEQEKARELKQSQRQVEREKKKGQQTGSMKNGVIVGSAVGVGVVMLFTQFVALGLLTLSAAGGAVLGYKVRVRQERLGWSGLLRLGKGEEYELLEADPVDAEPAASSGKKAPQSDGKGDEDDAKSSTAKKLPRPDKSKPAASDTDG